MRVMCVFERAMRISPARWKFSRLRSARSVTMPRRRADVAAVATDATAYLERVSGNGATPQRPLYRSLGELREHPELLLPPEAAIPYLAYNQRVTMLAATEKTGKTTLCCHA